MSLGARVIDIRKKRTYAASTNGIVSTGVALGPVSLAYLFHPAANTRRVEITRMVVSFVGGTGGLFTLRGAFLTAENGVPGGTVQTINAYDQDSPASTLTFRTGAAAPVRLAGDLVTHVADPTGDTILDWRVGANAAEPIVLRPGVNEGFEIRSAVGIILAVAASVAISYEWTEIGP